MVRRTPPIDRGSSQSLGAILSRGRVRRHLARPAELRLARPTVSFTFDGFPRSAARTGAALLEHVNGRATFYASAGMAGRDTPVGPAFDADDLRRLVERGHEIGCGTFSRPDCSRLSRDAALADMVRNAEALAQMGLEERMSSFAYPGGVATVALKNGLPTRFACARGAEPGLASGHADLAQLRANALFGPGALRRCLAVLETARRQNGWVIFFAQDVGPRPGPRGAATAILERLCGAAVTGGMRLLPVREALACARAESVR